MQKTILTIISKLNKLYRVGVRRRDPFRTLVGTVLSQRTRDEVTWPTNDKLFRVVKKPEDFLKLSENHIANLIKPVGFYNQKAKRIKEISKILVEKYGGKVPRTREKLMQLPGVGGKTADIVLSHCFNQPVIACDTHVIWVANQLEWTNSKNPEKVREDLHKLIPIKYRKNLNLILVQFGKQICNTGRPKCFICSIKPQLSTKDIKEILEENYPNVIWRERSINKVLNNLSERGDIKKTWKKGRIIWSLIEN